MSGFDTLHEITFQSVQRAAGQLQAAGIDPETIDLPDLMRAVAEVAESRPEDGQGRVVLSLLRLAALALLWSQSVDDLHDVLGGVVVVDVLLDDLDRARGNRPALGEGSVY